MSSCNCTHLPVELQGSCGLLDCVFLRTDVCQNEGCNYYSDCISCSNIIPLDPPNADEDESQAPSPVNYDILDVYEEALRAAIAHYKDVAEGSSAEEVIEARGFWRMAHNALEFDAPGTAVRIEASLGV